MITTQQDKLTSSRLGNITKGEHSVIEIRNRYYDAVTGKIVTVATVHSGDTATARCHSIPDALLYADAGTTANKCGLLPSELLAQRDELLLLIRSAIPYWEQAQREASYEVRPLTEARAAIAKAEGGAQ